MTNRPLHELSDTELMHAHYQGNDDAFAEIDRRHRERLIALAMRRMPGSARRERAEDLASEVLLKVFRTRQRGSGRYRLGRGSVSAWLSGILYNHVASFLRRRKGKEFLSSDLGDRHRENLGDILEETLVTAGSGPAEEISAREQLERLQSALNNLAEGKRTLLTLRYWKGETLETIGKQLGVSITKAHRQEKSALAELRNTLESPAKKVLCA